MGMGYLLLTGRAGPFISFWIKEFRINHIRIQTYDKLTLLLRLGYHIIVKYKSNKKYILSFHRLQAQSALASVGSAAVAVKYAGPMDVARHVLKSEGGVRGLFKGLFPTLAREVPGNAAMFGVYEATKQYLAGSTDTSKLGRGSLIVAGGLAGGTFWLSVYPTDVIKSVIQVDDYKNPKFSGFADAFRKIIASEGVKGLYKGFGPAMARSVPANAACFLAYEITRSTLG